MTRNKSNTLLAGIAAAILGLVLGYSATYKENLGAEDQQQAVVARTQECVTRPAPVPEEPHD